MQDAISNISFYKQEFAISNVQQELNYVRKELIEARANKSASDDKLNNVQDQIDTMQNNINSLTDEGNFWTRPFKVEKILKGSLDLISSPSPLVKIQIRGGEFA